MSTTLPSFTPPSPGAWELEQTHMTRPVSVFMADIFPAAMSQGFREGTRAYGVLLDQVETAVINRFLYATPRPVGAPKGAKGPPPRILFALMTRLHPELRRRIKRAEDVWRDRYWREDVKWWHAEVKPSIGVKAQGFLKENPATMETAELVDHVRRAAAFAGETLRWHHRFNICAMLPIGDFVCHVMDWTGMTATDILHVVRGLSPASAGAVEELAALRRAILLDAEAMATLLADRPAEDVLRDLEANRGPVGAALRAYLDVVGLRIIGAYDVSERHAREQPALLVSIIRTAVTSDEMMRQTVADQAIAGLRARVPAEHRVEFDSLLEEVRVTYGMRDERVFYGDQIGIGIARRALLAAGERLRAQGLVRDPTHTVDASLEEVIALLEGRGGPSAEELEARTRFRLETPMSAAPARLGVPPSGPPPADWLPPAAARMQRSIGLVLSLMFDTHKATGPDGKKLKGFGVSPGTYEGPARLFHSVEELSDVKRGEIVVTAATTSTFNVVLPLIGALVTERGGALCHAAIVAREYGLPGVVGCPGALSAITTGMRIRVDGGTGEVWTAI